MTKNILDILNSLKVAEPVRTELNFIIKKSYTISISFLKAKFASKLSSLSLDGNGLEDLAMDAIVPLFVKNKEGVLGISWALQKWKDPILNDVDADYFLSRIIWRRVDQSVTKLLKERDPIFAKILKTLNFCISTNEYQKVRYFGTVYVMKVSTPQNEINGPVINEENFYMIPNNFFGDKQTNLFEKIFTYLEEQTEFFPAIPLNLLVQSVKNYHSDDTEKLSQYDYSMSDQLFLNTIVEVALGGIKEKLDVYYVSKNKMSHSEAEMIYASFTDISKDFLNGGMHGSLYSYLKHQDSSLTKDIFYSKYNNRVSYLLSLLKKDLADNISA